MTERIGTWVPGVKPRYEVVVGNIGTVASTADRDDALRVAKVYEDQSRTGYGRASGETVTVLCDGEPVWEFDPVFDEED